MKNHFQHMTANELARAFAIAAARDPSEGDAGPAHEIIEAASCLPAHQRAEFLRLKDLGLEAIFHANLNAILARSLERLSACASWTATSWQYTAMLVDSMRHHMARVGMILSDIEMGETRDRLIAQNQAFLVELKHFGEVAKENQARAAELHDRERNELARIVAEVEATTRSAADALGGNIELASERTRAWLNAERGEPS
jgi:hypothetical protein